MDPVATGTDTRETRMLAAIVFTDVVGFSRLASQNESRVYVALQRDMGVITTLCRQHGGQVLNTMGDGMLLCFMSAVDAMSCSLDIQRTLFNQAKALPAQDVLHHRIGVHLGDVIMSGDNVFGDGVNVAARLQAAAKPDSICYSHTVHEVVKNKLKIESTHISQQQLKNLGEPVKMWLVPPISEGPKALDLGLLQDPQSEASKGASGLKGMIMIIVSLGIIAVLALLFRTVKVPKWVMVPKDPPVKVSKGPVVPDKVPGTTPAPTPAGPTKEQVQAEIQALRPDFAFDRIVALLETAGANAPEDELKKLTSYREMESLMEYLSEQLAQTDMAAPLRVPPTVPGGEELIFASINGQLQTMEAGQFVTTTYAKLGAEKVDRIARALSENQVHNRGAAPPEVKGWTETFEREYLPTAP